MSKESVSVEWMSNEFKKVKFSGVWITDQVRFLLGRVLTIVDASVVDPKQNKAMKDLIKGEFIEKLSHVSGIVAGGKDIEAPEDFDPTAPMIGDDEALGLN